MPFSKRLHWFEAVKKLILSCFLFPLVLAAQVVETSAPVRLPAKANKFRIVGKNNDGIMVRLYGTEDLVQIYTDDLKLATAKTIEFKNQSGLLQYIMLNKTGAVFFYLQQEKRYSVLLAQPVNSKLVEIGKPIALDTIEDRKELVAQNLRFKASADQNFLYIYYPFFSGSEVQSMRCVGLDHALNKLYRKTFPAQHSEKEMEDSRSLMDNNGNGYLLIPTMQKEEGPRVKVYRLSSAGEFATYDLVLPQALFGELYTDLDNKNGHLVAGAFYDKDGAKGEDAANGFLFATYEPATGEKLTTREIPFPNDFMKELTGREVKDEARLYTFTIRRIVLRNDGGALLLAESFIKDTREVPAPTGMGIGFQPGFNNFIRSTIYQFNDIIAFSINKHGVAEWNTIMRKKQVSEDDNGFYSSFMIMNEKDKLRLLYLDDAIAQASLNQFILSSEGKAERKEILNQESNDVMLLPKSGRQLSPREVLLPSYKAGELKLLKLTF